MTATLKPDETIPLSSLEKVVKKLRVAVHWQLLPDLKNPPEGDIFAFLLDKNGAAPTNEDFVFYNQPDGPNGNAQLQIDPDNTAEKEGGVQSVTFALPDIRYGIVTIVVGFNLYRAGERDQSMRFVQKCELTLSEEGKKPMARFEIDPKEHRDAICIRLLKLERDGNDWQITALAEECPNFDGVARQYGIVVAGG